MDHTHGGIMTNDYSELESALRWPNTVFAGTLAMRFSVCTRITKTNMPLILSLLFFFVTECSVLMILVFYYKGMLEKVTVQRTKQFSGFSLISQEPCQMQHIGHWNKGIFYQS